MYHENQGRKLVIVTTDNYEITYKCLDKLGIKELFDAVFADDGTMPVKPDPSCILEYFKANGISADSAVMVGDTMTDVRFARNAGMNIIAVGKTEKNKQQRFLQYRRKPHSCGIPVLCFHWISFHMMQKTASEKMEFLRTISYLP